MLGLSEADSWFDPRVGGRLRTSADRPVHEYAQYILKEVVEPSGLLLTESVLAARLGVDLGSNGWPILEEALKAAAYSGAFALIRQRWWAPKLDTWWRRIASTPARMLSASERSALLSKALEHTFHSPSPIEKRYSDKFWTVCAAYVLPLDPRDGFMVDRPDPKPWQEASYVSAKAVLLRDAAKANLKVHPLERARLQLLLSRARDGEEGT